MLIHKIHSRISENIRRISLYKDSAKMDKLFQKIHPIEHPTAQFDQRVLHTNKYAQNDENDLPYTSMYGIRGMRASNEVEILNKQC